MKTWKLLGTTAMVTALSLSIVGITSAEANTISSTSVNDLTSSSSTELASATAAIPAGAIVVDQKGSGQYQTVQAAINSIPANNNQQKIIYIKNGTYTEKLTITQPRITLQGESATGTILSYNATNVSSGSTTNSASTTVKGDYFQAKTITFRNNAGINAGQAVAFYNNADKAVYTDVRFLGHQDTVYTPGTGRQYFKNCYIEGTVDFIFGSATAVFDQCQIHSLGAGYVTAASTGADTKYGYVFLNSRLTSSGTANQSVYLGRPWRPYSAVTYINTDMGAHIQPTGWDNWRDPANEATARYYEYASKGAGANNNARVKWAKFLTNEQAKAITIQTVLGGTDQWNPTQTN
jgi:pectinesterase